MIPFPITRNSSRAKQPLWVSRENVTGLLHWLQDLFQIKIENICVFKLIKKKHGNVFKKWLCPNFLLLPKKSELPKIWGGCSPPRPPRPVRLWAFIEPEMLMLVLLNDKENKIGLTDRASPKIFVCKHFAYTTLCNWKTFFHSSNTSEMHLMRKLIIEYIYTMGPVQWNEIFFRSQLVISVGKFTIQLFIK